MKLKYKLNLWSLLLVVCTSSSSVLATDPESNNLQDARPSHEQGKPRFHKPRFADLDLNQDTFLTLEEFKQQEIPHDDHDKVFGHIDADGNGEITEQEFAAHRPPKRRDNRGGKQSSNY